MQGDEGRRVAVYEDREAMSLAAAGLFAVQARRAAQAGRRCSVLLSGGETPRRCYQLLGEEPLKSSVPWQSLQLFWGDERYVPYRDPLSNFGMARQALLDHVPLDEGQLHPIPVGPTPAEAAAAYEGELRRYFDPGAPRFELALLGLGENGHTASLFPGTAPVRETGRWVCDLYLAEEDQHRITVTAPLLNSCAVIAFLVSGRGKAEILREVLEGLYDPERIPAQLVRPEQGRVLWLADREAARLLSPSTTR